MHGGQSEKFIVAPALAGDEVIDGMNLFGNGGRRAHHKEIGADLRAAFQQSQRCRRRIHWDIIKVTDGVRSFLRDLIGENMTMCVNDFHFSVYPSRNVGTVPAEKPELSKNQRL